MPLHSVPFTNSSRLADIEKGGAPMFRGEQGYAIALVQAGLIDLGFKLPFSTRPDGTPDGVFGKETYEVLRQFQAKNGLRVDGAVGVKTIRQMDAALVAKTPPAAPPPAAPPPAAITTYRLGIQDPPVHPDPGAGPWNSQPTTVRMFALREAFLDLGWGGTWAFVGPDATSNLLHYLEDEGNDWWIDLDKMIREVPSARVELNSEVARAKTFSETLAPGTYDIVSTGAVNGYNDQDENKNWFLAVGGYSYWGKGHLVVTDAGGGGHYDLLFEYHFYDRYNWDKIKLKNGTFVWKSTNIVLPRPVAWSLQRAGFDPGTVRPEDSIHVTDELMGRFQLEGLGMEYDYYGLAKRRLEWNQGDAIISPAQVDRALQAPRM